MVIVSASVTMHVCQWQYYILIFQWECLTNISGDDARFLKKAFGIAFIFTH